MDYKIQKINFVEFAKNAKIKCNAKRVGFTYTASPSKPLATMIQPIAPCKAPNKNKTTKGLIILGLKYFLTKK